MHEDYCTFLSTSFGEEETNQEDWSYLIGLQYSPKLLATTKTFLCELVLVTFSSLSTSLVYPGERFSFHAIEIWSEFLENSNSLKTERETRKSFYLFAKVLAINLSYLFLFRYFFETSAIPLTTLLPFSLNINVYKPSANKSLTDIHAHTHTHTHT